MGVINRLAKSCYRALGHYTAAIHGERFYLDADHLKFWKKAAAGSWEPHTFEILSRFLTADAAYCDLGAWIGPTVLYAARKCRQVYCFEPDPVAFEYLLGNLRLNELRNVVPFHVAVGDRNGLLRLSGFGKRLGDSSSSLLHTSTSPIAVQVPCLTWEAVQQSFRLEKIDLLKIDVEGAEFALLPTMKAYLARHRPVLYVSTHAPYLEPTRRRQAMQAVVDAVADYRCCFNEELKAMPPSELVTEENCAAFRAFVFTP
jgi:FkbM family methyltransferase